MKSFKTEIYILNVTRLQAVYGDRLRYGRIENDCILNLDGNICYRNGERARVLEINGSDYILESEGRFILTKDEMVAAQIKNLENSMKTMENDLIAQGYTQEEVKKILSSRKAPITNGTKTGRAPVKKAIKSEVENCDNTSCEDEVEHMNTRADKEWDEQKKQRVENARRTRGAITNANYDGIKAQMEYTLESCRDFAEDYCDGWDGSDAQAVKCVLDDVVRVKGRDGRIRGNIQEAIVDWLMGLPMNIAFENYEILQLGEQWGYLPKVDYNSGDYTRKEAKWVDNWFMGIANNILKLARKFKVETPMPSYR